MLPALTEVLAVRNEPGIKTAGELLRMQFPDIRWIIKGLIGEGLTIIIGAPKIGKSWLVLILAIAAASGGVILGELRAEKTDTLYLALEDTERRIQSRLKRLNAPDTDSLKITTQWRDGYMGLEKYLQANNAIGLVIIDTLARFANIEDMNDYTITTNAMARLKRIADDLKIAIVLIHHAKKTGARSSGADWMESALGSTGLTGATDSTIFIDRKNREKPEATLYATGRDAADIKYYMKFDLDFGGWTIAPEPPKPDLGPSGGNKKTDKPATVIGGVSVQ
jgi:RecA-family ATPase